jgi:hypothetical protein
MPGRYLFLLAGSFDTTSLANGAYELNVRVADERGNQAKQSDRFSVLNAHGVCPGSLPAPPSTGPPPSEPPGDAGNAPQP